MGFPTTFMPGKSLCGFAMLGRRLRVLVCVLASVLLTTLLSGCGGGGGSESSGSDTHNESSVVPDPSDTASERPVDMARMGPYHLLAECHANPVSDLSVDAGSSHTLQTADYLHVNHNAIWGNHPSAAVAYADFNQDGHVDVFYAHIDHHYLDDETSIPIPAELYLNDGSGWFSLDTSFVGGNPPSLRHPRKALQGDFNGDGRPDVFALGTGSDAPPWPGEAPYVLLSSAGGYVVGGGLEDLVGYHHGGASADIDDDGDIDVFVTDNTAEPYFLINDGSGYFTVDTTRLEGLAHRQLFTAELVDVDDDEFLDLLVAGHEHEDFPTQILWGEDTGVFSTSKATTLPGVFGRGVVVDIDVSDTDGDGDKDIIINRTGDDRVGIYVGYYLQLMEQVGERNFEDKTEQLLSDNEDSEGRWLTWIRLCDINDDGHVDIVVDDPQESRHVNFIWENDGMGGFQRRLEEFDLGY